MSPRPPRSNESKAALKHILLTPPSSTELPRADSFSSSRDEHDSHDRSLFPFDDRSSSQDSDLPLFDPMAQKRPTIKQILNPEPTEQATKVPPASMPSSPGLDHLAARHRSAFAAQHPSIAPPSERDYQLFANFSLDMRERGSDRSPEQQPCLKLPPISSLHSQIRSSAPQYAPWYSTSPHDSSRPESTSYRRRSAEEMQFPQTSSPKKPRISPATLVSSDSRAATVPATVPSKRRRSSAMGPKRSRASTGSSSKEAKHNRNRSTKQRYSTNYHDYADYTPPASSMSNAMHAAEKVAEHKVNNRRDLKTDEHRHELHPAEVVAAQRLNIGCGDYILTKRQVLNEFVEYLRGDRKKAWNKTRAQSSSNLDVGKTSQLWTFFKDIGWFNEEFYEQALRDFA